MSSWRAAPSCRRSLPDIGTQLTLQVFTSLLGTCGLLATPGMGCTDAQIAQITADCGDPAAPTCTPACTATVSLLLPVCPLTFTDPAMVTLATTCGTNAAAAAAAPCAPGVVDGLATLATDCDAFTAAMAAADPCADIVTDLADPTTPLAVAALACGTGAPAGGNPADPTGIAAMLGLLGTCPPEATVEHFHRACCASGWPCATPTCGSWLDPTSCAGMGAACPAFAATDPDSQAVLLACTAAECDAAQVTEMQTACCPDGWVEADGTTGPCASPVCDADDCAGKLTEMVTMCPAGMAADDGVTAMIQRCEQVADAAAAAGLDDDSASACLTDNAATIRLMHRTCCPAGWTPNGGGCLPEPANCGQTTVRSPAHMILHASCLRALVYRSDNAANACGAPRTVPVP